MRNSNQTGKLAAIGALFLAAGCSINLPAFSDDESQVGYYSAGYKPIHNEEFIRDDGNATTYLFRAEMAIKNRQWDQAIIWLRKSIDVNDDDIDTHKCLAVCLENKLENDENKNSPLFKECIKEWLIVLRNTKGAEKGLTKKNGTSPTNNQRWEDELGAGMARTHLQKLCGSVPKQKETNQKFLARVTRDSETNVSVKMLHSSKKSVLDEDGF